MVIDFWSFQLMEFMKNSFVQVLRDANEEYLLLLETLLKTKLSSVINGTRWTASWMLYRESDSSLKKMHSKPLPSLPAADSWDFWCFRRID